MDESGINLNFDLDESDQERILEIVKSDLVDSVLSELPVSEFPNFDFYELRSKTVSLSTSLNESPTLKTEVVRSRTQLKQQLMRDQELMKEQERRRIAEEQRAIAAQTLLEPISIPVNVSSVQLPGHVLQVSSALQNPTRYHILAKRKNQVMQFLNSSDTEDFVSKFDAQKATLQVKQQNQQVQLEISQTQQEHDQKSQQIYHQKQFQQQQRILQRRQVQKRKEFQMEYQEEWHKNRLDEMDNMESKEKLEYMQLLEYEQELNEKHQEKELSYFQEQQQQEEMELHYDLIAEHELEKQQLLHRHKMEKQQLQQQFQLEKQQLQHQQEQMKFQQQMQKYQRQKQLQKQSEAEYKADAEALVKARAKIHARVRGHLNEEPSVEAENKDHEQKKLQKVAQGKAEAEEKALKDAQTKEQPQAQSQLLGQAQLQEPQQMQDEACALPLDHDISQRETLHHFISDLTKDALIADEKSVDAVSYVCYSMADNLYGPFKWSLGEPDSLSQDDSLNMKWTRSCPSGLENYEPELSPYSLHNAKSRIRKDNHNIVERRRRSNINDRIKELSDLLPKVNEPYYEICKDSKNNKGAILKAAVEYIKYLKSEVMKYKRSDIGNCRYKEENEALKSKLKEMQSKLKENEVLIKHQAWMITKLQSFDVSNEKDDEMDKNEMDKNESDKNKSNKNKSDKNESDKNESNKSEKSECGSAQYEVLMEEDDTDEDEIC